MRETIFAWRPAPSFLFSIGWMFLEVEMSDELKRVDHTAVIVNQVVIILLNILAFIFNLHWLVAVVAAVMLLGTLFRIPGFLYIYRYVLRPLKLANPHILLDNPEPHRFAQGFGGTVMLVATVSLFAGASLAGWVLVWLVVALAAINAFGGFCVGCFVYYWLSRLKIPGFHKDPPTGTFPGKRPKGTANVA